MKERKNSFQKCYRHKIGIYKYDYDGAVAKRQPHYIFSPYLKHKTKDSVKLVMKIYSKNSVYIISIKESTSGSSADSNWCIISFLMYSARLK